MAKGILGKKLGMTQIFTDDGHAIPVTVIEAGPCVVVQKKAMEKDGYYAIQLGFADFVSAVISGHGPFQASQSPPGALS